ncbi:hypothetical protein Tco_0475757 [Tanacetum coccineum]
MRSCRIEEELTWVKTFGKEVEECVTKVIAKDGTVTRFGGRFPHFIEEEEEKKPKPYNLYGFVDLMENEQVYAKTGFAPYRIPQSEENHNRWLSEEEEVDSVVNLMQAILLESVESRELKITGGGMHGILETRMAQNGQRSSDSDTEENFGMNKSIKFMKIDLDDKTDVLTYHKKLLAKAQKEKEDLKAKVEKWHNSSKNLSKLLNTQMSANDKFGLGYGDHRYDGILSYENEVLQSVFMNKGSELENQPLYDRFVTAEGMHDVPPPMTGNYMPSGPVVEIDDSKFTYGPKQTQTNESESQSSEFDTCESNISEEPSELVSEPVVNVSNVKSQPKVWSDAPIIEEYESDSDDEENVKSQYTHIQKPKVDKKDLGHGFAVRACFVCGSLNHLIRDCDFHEKRMARKADLNNGWNNVQRVNKQNQFVPSAVLTRTGIIPVNTARTSGTKKFSTARQSVNRQTVLTSTAMKVNTVKPIGIIHIELLKNKGIVDSGDQEEYSNDRTPHQIGVGLSVVQGPFIEAARTMLAQFLFFTLTLWAEARKRLVLYSQWAFLFFAAITTAVSKQMIREKVQERKNKSLWMNLKDLEERKGSFWEAEAPGRVCDLVNTVSLTVSLQSHEGLSLSDPTNPE